MKKEWIILLVIAFIIVIIVIFDWSKSSPKSNQSNQTNESNLTNSDVTVLVEYLKDKSDDKTMTFAVSLDTHSVELDSFDFEKDISLEKGTKSSNPTKVTTSGSGHHRSGEITFEKTSPPFTIVIKDLSQIPRREFVFDKQLN